MKKIFLATISFLALTACNVSGVDQDDIAEGTSNDSIKANSSKQGDEEAEDLNELLTDTINGQPNDMVYQSKDGLRVEWKKKTDNPKIGPRDVALVNYHARVAGGEEYDNNDEIGFPVPLKGGIGMMIEGWEKGIQQMAKGDEGRIMIPNALAYGEDGYLTIVPPNADIIVDIEIVDVIEPIALDEGVKVYKWKEVPGGKVAEKNQTITFDYFAYHTGEGPHMYDNSFKTQTPFSFKFENDNVMDGLHIGMQVVKQGENAFIEIPSKLAYGKKGLVDLVPSNRDVVYDVRVISIND